MFSNSFLFFLTLSSLFLLSLPPLLALPLPSSSLSNLRKERQFAKAATNHKATTTATTAATTTEAEQVHVHQDLHVQSNKDQDVHVQIKDQSNKKKEEEESKVIIKEEKEGGEKTLFGGDLLAGIREIIGRDGLLSEGDLQYKPFMGSFANVKSDSDPLLASTAYCMTDNHCGHMEAYSESTVPLGELQCNKFCYIDEDTHYYKTSSLYTLQNPPDTYLCCGWETCG